MLLGVAILIAGYLSQGGGRLLSTAVVIADLR